MKKQLTAALLLLAFPGYGQQERINGQPAAVRFPTAANSPIVAIDANGKPVAATINLSNAQTLPYTATALDFSLRKTITVASGTGTITLVSNTTQPPDGQYIDVLNYGTGVVTVARNGQLINGGTSSLTIPAGSATAPTGARIKSNGANYEAFLMGAGGSGGSPTVGPETSVLRNVAGAPTGDAGLTYDGNLFALTKPASVAGFLATASTSSSQSGDSNQHWGWLLNQTTAAEGVAHGFPTDTGVLIQHTRTRGWNDSSTGGDYGKLTSSTLDLSALGPASGQRHGFRNSLVCAGMGDCFGIGITMSQFGGCNDPGCEGTHYFRQSLEQGQGYVTNSTITAMPVSSTCKGTITQPVTKSATTSTSQLVTISISSGACLLGDHIDVERGVAVYDQNHEVTQITSAYNGTTIGAVFERNHNSGAAVNPAILVTVDSAYNFGELRELVITGGPGAVSYNAGIIASVSGQTFNFSGATLTPTIVGGDATTIGVFKANQDDYDGLPFASHGQILSAYYPISTMPSGSSLNVEHRSDCCQDAYTGNAAAGGTYKILPGARIFRVNGNTLVLEYNTFDWRVGQSVDNAYSTEGVVNNTNGFAWYTPGATLRNVLNMNNVGARTWTNGLSISQVMATGSGADTVGYGIGINLGAKFHTGISIANTDTAALVISSDPATYNANIYFGSTSTGSWIGRSGNPIQPYNLAMQGDGTPKLLFASGGAVSESNGQVRVYGGNLFVDQTNNGQVTFDIGNSASGSCGRKLRLEMDSPFAEAYFHYKSCDAGDFRMFGLSNSGAFIPAQNTAISGTNYGPAQLNFKSSVWHAGAALPEFGYLNIKPSSNATDAPMEFSVGLWDSVHNNDNYLNKSLVLGSDGKLSIGIDNAGFGPSSQFATIDPTGITAAHNYAFPDIGGTFAVSGGGQSVSFGGLRIVPTATDPGCAAGGDIGRIWFDSTTASDTALKVCMQVASTPTWVTK